jgi:KDO2-lipid IV(A) lauroyltransferase
VLTGIDRPVPDPGSRPRFFGRPAVLPMHHIFLATKARVPVMLMASDLQADGKYHIATSDLIEMDPDPDRERGAIRNAEKVLTIAEGFIRRVPQQWLVSLPVWPETLDLTPE